MCSTKWLHRMPFASQLSTTAAALRDFNPLLARAIVSGDSVSATRLFNHLSSLGHPAAARELLLAIPRPDLFLFNVLVRSSPSPAATLGLLASLPRRHPHLRPDPFTFSFAISACSSSLPSARILHAFSIVHGFSGDPFIGSALIDLYLKFAEISIAEKVFDRITCPDTVSWNTIISGLAKNSAFLKSLKVFKRMVALDTPVDATTLAVVLPVATELQDSIFGATVHCLGTKLGLESHNYIVTGLISMYSKCSDISAAEFLFDRIQKPDLIAYNAMISGYSTNGLVESSTSLFKELLVLGLAPNSSTMVGLIPVFNPFGHESLAQNLHGFSIKSQFDLNSSVATAITTVYTRLNDMESARTVFDVMPEKSVASWNAMISGYAQNGLTEMAMSLFQEMQRLNIRPNPVTVTSILSACAQLGALILGKWVHRIISEKDLEINVFVSTALIDMYAKCGSIEEARRIFNGMEEKNVVSWNAIISGYALHGHGREALKLFSEMANACIAPTKVTFLSALYACSHGGLVEEGRAIFRSMVSEHGIKPGPEHYACVVDLLGRAGQLNEAFDFIKTVPKSAGPGVWGALLGACMKHKETGLAQLASQRLFELEPDNPGYYVLLSNIYSATRNYADAATVRQAAKSKRLAKTPGCTLIEIGEKPHIFTSGDRSHPQTAAIYEELEAMTVKMVEAGYRPETDVAFYDVEEEEKEHMVRVHSEKLAIAFGLISTEPGSEFRIIKNLRVCLDCHTATKFISKITRRFIVVRDANRFHHFRDGVCSCGDYW